MSNHQNEKLATVLGVLKKLQDKHNGVVESNDLKNEQYHSDGAWDDR